MEVEEKEQVNEQNLPLPEHMDERVKMQRIRTYAEMRSMIVNNPYWLRAYTALADAADRIDGMLARSEDK